MTTPVNVTQLLGRIAAARAELARHPHPAPELLRLVDFDLPALLDEIVLQRTALLDVYDTATTLHADITHTLNDQESMS